MKHNLGPPSPEAGTSLVLQDPDDLRTLIDAATGVLSVMA